MLVTDRNHRSRSGPFGMGRQGYLLVAIVILASALFATTRTDWATMIVSALVLPLIVFALLWLVARSQHGGAPPPRPGGPAGRATDPLTFLARTNPLMFFLLGAAMRSTDDARYQELLRSGPFGLGQYGYLVALLIILAPLLLTLIITATTGQLPTHSTPHF